jgi:acetylornithine deacetylase/succinyl-diaminopimelate desuccinylase-like protein
VKELAAAVDFARLRDEAVGLLSEYLAIDTTNPPGDVSKAADWVQDVLGKAGIATKRLGALPDKPNVVATIPGRKDGSGDLRPFVLSHHMDVVGAPNDQWSVDPFGGVVKEGYVWGRGALDMKGFGVLTIVCALELVRLGLPLRRPLRLLVTADEEVGGEYGAKWLAQNHLDEAGGEFFWTEGSFGRERDEGTFYGIEVAQKGVGAVKLTIRGEPGHASAPTDDNAVVRMSEVLAKIGSYRSPLGAREFVVGYLDALPRKFTLLDGNIDELSSEELEDVLRRLRARGERAPTMMRNTFTPTMVHAGVGQNVIPAVCEAFLDCRARPGVDGEAVLAELASVIDDPTVELELVKNSVGTESPIDTELFKALSDAIRSARPGAHIVPHMGSGGTDAKHLRPHGVVCYGLVPFEPATGELHRIHGIDERVSFEDIERGLRIMFDTTLRMCAEDGA